MGSGKSTVGKSLARKLQFSFYDSDREIEARCGVDIPTIFEFEGEAGFRKRERKVLGELATLDNTIIATGGGAILNRSNRKLLRESGHVILLAVDLDEQMRRVALNRNRPLLQVGDVEAKLRNLMDERRSLYESTAHHVVSTNSSRMQNVVAKIARHLIREEIVDPPKESRATSQKTTPTTSRPGKRTVADTSKSKSAGTRHKKPQPAAKSRKPKKPGKNSAKSPRSTRTPLNADTAADADKSQDAARSNRKKTNTTQKKQ